MSTLNMSLTIQNNTSQKLELANYKGCDAPPNQIAADGSGVVTASSNFDISGNVKYQGDDGTITITFDMPLVGNNSFKGTSDPSGAYTINIKDTSGYDATPTAIITTG